MALTHTLVCHCSGSILPSAVADTAAEGATVVTQHRPCDGEEVVVSGRGFAHHTLALLVGGATPTPHNTGGRSFSGYTSYSTRCDIIGQS